MLIRDESFIHIQGWMVTRLGLKGLELMVYACIHGFCNDGESDYHGSRQYLADFCGTSVRNISRCLRSLLDRGLIVQTYHSIDNSEVRYITIVNPSDKLSLGVVTNCHEGSDKMTQGSCQIVTRVVTNCHQLLRMIIKKILKVKLKMIIKCVVTQSAHASKNQPLKK